MNLYNKLFHERTTVLFKESFRNLYIIQVSNVEYKSFLLLVDEVVKKELLFGKITCFFTRKWTIAKAGVTLSNLITSQAWFGYFLRIAL
jgi:hypothetical protein